MFGATRPEEGFLIRLREDPSLGEEGGKPRNSLLSSSRWMAAAAAGVSEALSLPQPPLLLLLTPAEAVGGL